MLPDRTFIYVLLDPRDNGIRYVGLSAYPKQRYIFHCETAGKTNTPKGRWICALKRLGLMPVLSIRYELPTRDRAIVLEARLIKALRACKGDRLTNSEQYGVTKVRRSVRRRLNRLLAEAERIAKAVVH
jgi:hypothetical protein